MLLVMQKIVRSTPDEPSYFWRVAAEWENETDLTDDRLEALGPGEYKLLSIDPEKATSVSKSSDPLVRHVEVKVSKPRTTLKDIK